MSEDNNLIWLAFAISAVIFWLLIRHLDYLDYKVAMLEVRGPPTDVS